MIVKPKIRGFICTTSHPIGCEKAVAEQIAYVKKNGKINGHKNVLVIGSSTGYGLASRIVSAFGSGAKTLGISYEKQPCDDSTGSAGWYNTFAFEKFAVDEGLYAKSISGDAFSDGIKKQAMDMIAKDMGKIDLVIYSLASPRRTHPTSGQVFNSVLKPIGKPFTNKTVDPFRGQVKEITIEPANETEIEGTVAVMGGEDWEMWMDLLAEKKLLAPNAATVAYTYIGLVLTHAIYKNGTIGMAKKHLYATAEKLTKKYADLNLNAFLSVNKALVTQASAAIPVVPLYISLLYKVMKKQGTHEGCIEQMDRMFRERVFANKAPIVDAEGYVRMDDYEMAPEVQQEIAKLWQQVTTENLETLTDIEGYRDEFGKLFGFNFADVDYDADVDPICRRVIA
jgi:enoyl-[acyl-carrier protein] reductase / trans-2-enoyl-CoA reductase (NAD+)